MQTFFIRLPRANDAVDTAQWLVVDSVGASSDDVHTGTLIEAAAAAAGRRVIVLIHGNDVVLAQPELPVRNQAKLVQLVPFALEEQLAGDVEDHHFAIGKRSLGSTTTPVAAILRTRIESIMQTLTAAGIAPEAIYADTSVLPVTTNGLTVLVDNARLLIKRGEDSAVSLDVDPLIEGLQLALASGSDSREHVIIYMRPQDYEADEDLIEGLREFTASLQIRLLTEGPLPLLAANAITHPPVNLLQGKYAVHSPLNISLRQWRVAAVLAGLFIVMNLGINGYRLWKLSGEEKQLDMNISQLFSQAMPGVKAVDVRSQVQSRLNNLRAGGGSNGLLQSLAGVGEALTQTPGTRIESLAYRSNTVDLRVDAPDVGALDRIQHIASEHGMTAEIQGATPREKRIEGRLKLKAPGA
jgi:general secretion pathway protein L